MDSILTLGRSGVDYLWSNYDALKHLEQICRDESGKRLYRGGQLVWKTKALIAENNLLRLKELCTVNQI